MRAPQRPLVHGTPLQQSQLCVQTCPYCAHVVPPTVGGEPLSLPPVGVPLAPHVPLLAPAGIVHGEPAQQSAVVVHAPPVGTHAVAPHTKGGLPAAFGTHGLPQQSALEAHAVPAGGGPLAQS